MSNYQKFLTGFLMIVISASISCVENNKSQVGETTTNAQHKIESSTNAPTSLPPIFDIVAETSSKGISFTSTKMKDFSLGPFICMVKVNNEEITLAIKQPFDISGDTLKLTWSDNKNRIEVTQLITKDDFNRVRVKSFLKNISIETMIFNNIDIFTTNKKSATDFKFGKELASVRILEQNQFDGHTRSLGQIATNSDGRTAMNGMTCQTNSQAVTLLYNPLERAGLLIGFESFERFNGVINTKITGVTEKKGGNSNDSFINVGGKAEESTQLYLPSVIKTEDIQLEDISIGFEGANIPIEKGHSIDLESFTIELDSNPFTMLEQYADRVAKKYPNPYIPDSYVNWCSWYVYKITVSDQLILENAKMAAKRNLSRLGLRTFQVDLGWEQNNIPTYFEENERFNRGLKWLSENLRKEGFELGVWTGFGCVSKNHWIAKEHPEWLVHNKEGQPIEQYKWFWAPYDAIYTLDVTHPEAHKWMKDGFKSLSDRGVRYIKWDFGGTLAAKGQRYDPSIACSGALEGNKITCKLFRETMDEENPGCILFDCTQMETANLGKMNMIYTCLDTENPGCYGWTHLRNTYCRCAAHFFKNKRWGLITPSEFVIGLPGTIEEARMRASATFLLGGGVDISDNLINFPEERWKILLSTLPVVKEPAKALDLFYPFKFTYDFESSTEPQGALIWLAPVKEDWDEWRVLAIFNYFEKQLDTEVNLKSLNLGNDQDYWVFEFWSEHFLGSIPEASTPKGYPSTNLLRKSGTDTIAIAFAGPAVKHLIIRKKRTYPWPLATSLHQSGGSELYDVKWDSSKEILSGKLCRPINESGKIYIATPNDETPIEATVDNRSVISTASANGSFYIPVITRKDTIEWRITFKK